jgi:large subunit ribosomal protein L6
MNIVLDSGVLTVKPESDSKTDRSLHGLTRTLLNNMVVGVTEGFKKELEIQGVGYRCQMKGKDLDLTLGFSHPVVVCGTDEITIEAPTPNKIIISGIDNQKVGQFAAEVRGIRPPEPYKGKGVRYVDEVVKRKEGKAAKGKK